MRLQTRAPAKINACLLLGPVREQDSRHELVTVMQSLSLCDRLVLTEAQSGRDEVLCPGVDEAANLAAHAIALFREQTGWSGPAVRVEIDKRIPIAGGMAGGSADAGGVLRLLHHATGLADLERVERIAAALGADVPSQVRPGRTLATGAGEIVERVPGVGSYGVAIVRSDRGLSTADVYREADRLGLARSAERLATGAAEIREALPDLPDALCVNELEPAALSLRPDLRAPLDRLRAEGADVAMVSGSGPTVVGLFHDAERARAIVATTPGAEFATTVGPDVGEVT